MVCRNPGCFGNYDFDHIVAFARRRYIDGFDTVTLLEQAKTETEKEEIALVCMLDIEDDKILDLQLTCKYDKECKVTNCRDKLKKMIEQEIAARCQ
jgi:hypothetical protein